MSGRYEVTLLRDATVEATGAVRPIRRLRQLPVTASSEQRVSAELRRLSDELMAEHPRLAWFEVLAGDVPAIALIDHRFPILICLYETAAFLAVDTSLAATAIRGGFRQANAYVAFLDRLGYRTLVDHVTGTAGPVSDGLPGLTDRLRELGRRGGLGRLQFDSRVWFIAGWAGTALVLAGADRLHGRDHPLWLFVLIGLPLGLILAGFQYWHDQHLLQARLREIRDAVAVSPGSSDTVRFQVPSVWRDVVLTILVLGGFAALGVALGRWSLAIFLAAVAIASVTYLLLSDRASVILDATGIEGLGRAGRRHIPFGDVDRIEQSAGRATWTVSSAAGGAIWIPRSLTGRDQMIEILTERVETACLTRAEALSLDDGQLVVRVEQALGAARRGFWFGRNVADRGRRPLFMMRRHPLRGQYSWRRHLLARGGVAIGHVIGAPEALRTAPDDWMDSPHPLLVLFSLDRQWPGRLEDGDPDAVARFESALARNAGFPLMARVPAALTGGHHVYCTSLMTRRRDMPLGHLRSWWLPILVDPGACRFTIVVPPRYWSPAVRRQWKSVLV